MRQSVRHSLRERDRPSLGKVSGPWLEMVQIVNQDSVQILVIASSRSYIRDRFRAFVRTSLGHS